jgi:hypothetical protein
LNGYPTIRWHGMSDPGACPWLHTPMDTRRGDGDHPGSRENTCLSGYYTAITLDRR